MTIAKPKADAVRLPKANAVIAKEVARRAEWIWGYVRIHCHSLDSDRTCMHIADAIQETNELVQEELKISRAAYASQKAEYQQLETLHHSLLSQVEVANLAIAKLTLGHRQLEAKLERMEAREKKRKESETPL